MRNLLLSEPKVAPFAFDCEGLHSFPKQALDQVKTEEICF